VLEKDILLSIFTEYIDLRRYTLLTENLFRSLYEFDIQEEFEYVKGVIRIRKSKKDRLLNG